MRYPAYEAYKDSGVEWLGVVPKHWNILPLTMYERTKRTGYEDEQLLSVYRDYGVVPKASRDDNFNKPSEDLSPYQLVEPGDFAMNKMKAWQGSVAISEHRGIVSPAYFVFKSKHQEFDKYLHYLLRSPRYITGYLSLSKGIRVNQWDLDPQYLSRMPVILPPVEEQKQIAAFLDRETAVIDTLIAKQEELIRLLGEKRTAVISHAVTKGLNPHAPMKDSGIEWLGQIPAHWIVTRIGYYARVGNGSTPNRSNEDYWTNGEIPWLNSSKVNEGYIYEAEQFITSLAIKECHLPIVKVNSILMAITGEGKTRGTTALLKVNATINQHLAYIELNSNQVDPEYLHLYFKAQYFRIRHDSAGWGSTKAAITCDDVRKYIFPLPPIEEQQEIIASTLSKIKKIDKLIQRSEDAISLLRERRSALISAAVTGKIDVRHA
jgi:type I restriction enzyme S subunit